MSEILLIDDERSIRSSMRAMLESEGFAVRTARSGDEAVRLFSERRPDVVLLDVMMPGKGGVQTCEELREIDPLAPILFLTAMPSEGVARCRAAWARLAGRQTAVVHGDPNPRNIRITAERVAMIDWDESHVDVPDLDLVLPHNAAGLKGAAHDIAAQASAAWEAAVCWDDDYSKRRLAEVRAV